jgi:hypothetical protein
MNTFSTTPWVSLEVGRGDIASIPDQRLRSLAEYWFERRKSGGIPSRSAIDPLDFPALLPNIILVERIGQQPGERYRFRLVGTDVVAHAGRELTGSYVDEVLPSPYYDYVRLLNRTTLEQALPVYSSSLYHDEGNFVNGITYRLLMPLAGGQDGATAMLLICQFWQRRVDAGAWNGDWRNVAPEIRVIADPA